MRSEHVYTTSVSERDDAVAAGWTDEGVECFVYPARPGPEGGLLVPLDGTVNLYRLSHPGSGDHAMTTSVTERDDAVAAGWTDEGVECFVYPARPGPEGGFLVPLDGTVDLHRLYNPAIPDHLYTTSASERDEAVAVGWTDEGVECFVYPARPGPEGGLLVPLDGAVNLYRLYRVVSTDDGGSWLGALIEGVVDTFTHLARPIVDSASKPADIVLGGAASIVGWGETLPIVGRFISGGRNVATAVVDGLASIPEIVMGWLGIRPEKRMKLLVVIQRDEQGQPVTTTDRVSKHLAYIIDSFKAEANVVVNAVGDTNTSNDYIQVEPDSSAAETLDVRCGMGAFYDNIVTAGPSFDEKMLRDSYISALPRLVGHGSAVIAFAVRKFLDPAKAGCSLGPLTDYVTVDFSRSDISILAHEVGHACNLSHVDDDDTNLMKPGSPRGRHLSSWQITKVRISRHVTYL
jgi:Repeat of unknown function (DUF5648)